MALTELLSPQNSTVIFIDHQPQMLFGVGDVDRQALISNTVALARTAKAFKVPTVLTSVGTQSFSGHLWPQLTAVLSENRIFERTSMNSWEDAAFVAEIRRIGRKKLVIAALWTEVCLAFPALMALADGHEVYAVVDASGGTSKLAHDTAVQRMVQAGVRRSPGSRCCSRTSATGRARIPTTPRSTS